MTKESRQKRTLKREAKEYRMMAEHAGEEMKDLAEEAAALVSESGLQEMTSLVKAMERFNSASKVRQKLIVESAAARGIIVQRHEESLDLLLAKLRKQNKEPNEIITPPLYLAGSSTPALQLYTGNAHGFVTTAYLHSGNGFEFAVYAHN